MLSIFYIRKAVHVRRSEHAADGNGLRVSEIHVEPPKPQRNGMKMRRFVYRHSCKSFHRRIEIAFFCRSGVGVRRHSLNFIISAIIVRSNRCADQRTVNSAVSPQTSERTPTLSVAPRRVFNFDFRTGSAERERHFCRWQIGIGFATKRSTK